MTAKKTMARKTTTTLSAASKPWLGQTGQTAQGILHLPTHGAEATDVYLNYLAPQIYNLTPGFTANNNKDETEALIVHMHQTQHAGHKAVLLHSAFEVGPNGDVSKMKGEARFRIALPDGSMDDVMYSMKAMETHQNPSIREAGLFHTNLMLSALAAGCLPEEEGSWAKIAHKGMEITSIELHKVEEDDEDEEACGMVEGTYDDSDDEYGYLDGMKRVIDM